MRQAGEALELRQRRIARLDLDEATRRVATKERTLRALVDLDLLYVVERQHTRALIGVVDAIDIGCDWILNSRRIRGRADSADARLAELAHIHEVERGDQGRQILGGNDAGLLQLGSRQCRHGNRYALQILVALLRGHRDFLQRALRKRTIRARRSLRMGHARTQHESRQKKYDGHAPVRRAPCHTGHRSDQHMRSPGSFIFKHLLHSLVTKLFL